MNGHRFVISDKTAYGHELSMDGYTVRVQDIQPAGFVFGGAAGKVFEIKPDGTLVVEKEDATEAAAAFWNAVRVHVEASFKAYADQRENSPARRHSPDPLYFAVKAGSVIGLTTGQIDALTDEMERLMTIARPYQGEVR